VRCARSGAGACRFCSQSHLCQPLQSWTAGWTWPSLWRATAARTRACTMIWPTRLVSPCFVCSSSWCTPADAGALLTTGLAPCAVACSLACTPSPAADDEPFQISSVLLFDRMSLASPPLADTSPLPSSNPPLHPEPTLLPLLQPLSQPPLPTNPPPPPHPTPPPHT